MPIRMLDGAQVEQALSMADAIEANSEAYAMVSAGTAVTPQRTPIQTPNGVSLFMPAFLEENGALAVKVVSIFEHNPQKGLPVINAVVMVFDSTTGLPVGILDGTRLTAIRTGAGAGAATRLLARKDAQTFGLIGAGGMARDQARAVLAVRDIREVRVYSPSGRSAETLAARLGEEFAGVRVRAVSSPAEAVRGADVVTCVTTSREPVFDPADLSPGAHVNGVGSFRPEMKEVPVWGLDGVRVFVDQMEAVMTEAGELLESIDRGVLRQADLVELGRVIAGGSAGRTSDDQITFFKSVGVAAQDAASARVALENAAKMKIGTAVDM